MSLLGVSVSDPLVPRALAPALLAYLIYDLCAAITASIAYFSLRDALIRRLWRPVYSAGLHSALKPGTLTFWMGEKWTRPVNRGPVATWRERMDIAVGVALIAGPCAYVFSAYARLISREGGAAVVLVSGAFAGLMVIRAFLAVMDD